MASAPEISLVHRTSHRRLGLFGQPYAIAALAAFVVLGVAAVGWRVSHHGFGYFTRDPDALAHQPPYMGMVSFFGLFAWAAGATALACAGYVASLRGAMYRRNALFLAAAAVAYLMLDDSFQFHEYVFPRYFHLPDSVVQTAYVVAVVFAVVKGRRFILSTNVRLLVAAGVFLAMSIGVDVVISSERTIGLEDGSKLLGIYLLAAYCVETALAESRATFRQLTAPAAEAAHE